MSINRREALGLAAAAAVVPAARVAAAQAAVPPDPVRLAKPVAQSAHGLSRDALTFAPNVSADGRNAGAVFDKSMVFSLGPKDALTGTWAAALQIPQAFRDRPPVVVYAVNVRGAVDKPAAARVAVTLDVGGVAKVLEFPFGGKVTRDWDEVVLCPVPAVVVEGKSEQGNPTSTSTPLLLPYFPVAVTVTLQRAKAQDEVTFQLVSLDVEALAAQYLGAGKKAK